MKPSRNPKEKSYFDMLNPEDHNIDKKVNESRIMFYTRLYIMVCFILCALVTFYLLNIHVIKLFI